ncbi:MAG: isoaspartyl peptidase/L-asparaginase [bacterium]
MVSIAVHGGAWDIPDDLVELHRFGVQKAITIGMAVLNDGGSAVDAVEAAITILEDDDTFNAGTGAFLNAAGEIELDASIMDGRTINAGAIAAVQQIKNPIILARKIMEESDHVLLVGLGAVRFAKEHGVRTCSQDELITEKEIERWREWQRKPMAHAKDSFRRKKISTDTVGAVALDRFGNIASGTSTGGLPNKFPGRVGDSPLIGAATYADNGIGGVSTTGWGEAMIRVVMAKSVIDSMARNGNDPAKATMEGIKLLEQKTKGYGGIIAMNPEGKVGMAYDTPRMARGYMNSDLRAPWVAV